jgi:hypothetical protein
MNRVATWKILALLGAGCAAGHLYAESLDSVDGPNVRVMRHEDGSRTVFTRSPDNRTLTKRTVTANNVLMMMTVYRMDANGNPLSCKIYDAQREELYKASYGYHKTTGLLLEERLFDSRVKRIDPNTGREMPVRRYIYTYDAQGQRSKPIAITLIPGKTAEEVYGAPSALESNPFLDEAPGTANPNARPLRR